MRLWRTLTDNEKNQLLQEKIKNPFLKVQDIAKKYNIGLAPLKIFYQQHHATTLELTGIKYRKYNVQDDYFSVIDSHEKAYFLGVMYSDGYLIKEGQSQTKRIGLDIKDIDWLQDLSDELKSEAPLYKTDKPGIKRLKVTSTQLYDDLIKLGCYEHKTFILDFPSESQVPKKYIYSFILGLSDGDGSVTLNGRGDYGWSLTGTKELLTGIKHALNLNNKLYQRWPERKNNNYTLSIHGTHCVAQVLNKIYKNAPSFCLKRKYNNYLTCINDSRIRPEDLI